MKPMVKEFQDDMAVVEEVKMQSSKGVSKDNLYVLSHDNDRTKRITDKVNANEIGVKEQNLKVATENIFNQKGDEIRNKLQEIGFSEDEAGDFEEKLDHGKVLLIITE